jgi:hypothetical protein
LGTARKGAHTAQKSGARQTLFKKSLSRKYATRTNALKYKYKNKERTRRERRGTRARGPKPKISVQPHWNPLPQAHARTHRHEGQNCRVVSRTVPPHCLGHTRTDRRKMWASRTGTPLPKAHARTHKRRCKSNSHGPPVGKRGRPAQSGRAEDMALGPLRGPWPVWSITWPSARTRPTARYMALGPWRKTARLVSKRRGPACQPRSGRMPSDPVPAGAATLCRKMQRSTRRHNAVHVAFGTLRRSRQRGGQNVACTGVGLLICESDKA